MGQDHNNYRVRVRYRLKSIYLANLLTADQMYETVSYSWNSINLRYKHFGEGFSHMHKNSNSEQIKAQLVQSKKVRVDEGTLNNLINQPDGSTQLIFLLSDAAAFIQNVKADKHLNALSISFANLDQITAMNRNTIVVSQNEIPGPLAIVNTSWEDVAKMVMWECVLQVEENQRYSATEG